MVCVAAGAAAAGLGAARPAASLDMDSIDYGDRKERRKRKVSNYQVQSRLPNCVHVADCTLPEVLGAAVCNVTAP